MKVWHRAPCGIARIFRVEEISSDSFLKLVGLHWKPSKSMMKGKCQTQIITKSFSVEVIAI